MQEQDRFLNYHLNKKCIRLMAKGIFPSWAIKTPGMVDVWISFPKTISFDEIKILLRRKNIEITSTQYSKYNVIGLRIIRNRLNEIASFPFIEYIEPAPHGDQPLNYIAKQNSRGNILHASTGVGGYNLKGDGVVVGVGDNADPQYHIDFTGRLINFAVPVILIMVRMCTVQSEEVVLLASNIPDMHQSQL